MKNRRRKKTQKLKGLMIVLVVIIIAGMSLLALKLSGRATADSAEKLSETIWSEESSDPDKQDWCLILVNQDHPIPEGYQVELLKLSNGRKVDSRIYPDLQKMFDACRAQGFELFVREGYRTHEEQQEMFDEKIEAFMEEGCSRQEAEELTKSWVAIPGTSEHELGLAVDINPEMESPAADKVYSWLEDNSYKYGFIKRYPAEKADITGINNEPWHFRYVGYKAAEEMFRRGLCLEEYLVLGN